ncbi:MAG: hypothetical protein KF832_12740 [Caldilineaceae bacterium]|nr:hypothetical protein [Caldilineaceae bacterium]
MQAYNPHFHRLWLIVALSALLLIVAACGGGSGNASNTAAVATLAAVPTMPSGNFVAVGEQSGLTQTVTLTQTTAVTTASAAVPAPDLSRGEAAYTKNKCGDCHGAQGEGVADKASAIAGTALSLQEFDSVLRTGGGLGNTHIFGRSAVSPSGMEALYAYIQSLGQ